MLAIVALGLFLSGRGNRVTINSREAGKQITSEGLEDIVRAVYLSQKLELELSDRLYQYILNLIGGEKIVDNNKYLEKLQEMCSNHKYDLLYATYFGSTLYGTSISGKSDVD